LHTRCYIAGASEFNGEVLPRSGDYVIAADAGYLELVSRGITPDLVVGDFDSLGSAPVHPNTIHSPAEKDDTDVMLAVKQGFSRGFREFIINGGLGGRLDHTLANIQILVYLARREALGVLIGRDMCATAISNGTAWFMPGASGYISVFSAGGAAVGATGGAAVGSAVDAAVGAAVGATGGAAVGAAAGAACGVTLTGLKYPLDGAALKSDYPLGVSNEFTGAKAAVTVREGTLVITWAGGPELLENCKWP